MEVKGYKIYKGLQRPLVFKGFKGRFIYMALGGFAGSVVLGGIIAALVSNILGTIIILVFGGGTLMWVTQKQKKGLFPRQKKFGVYYIKPLFKNLQVQSYSGKPELIGIIDSENIPDDETKK